MSGNLKCHTALADMGPNNSGDSLIHLHKLVSTEKGEYMPGSLRTSGTRVAGDKLPRHQNPSSCLCLLMSNHRGPPVLITPCGKGPFMLAV